jgi:hypothetical protein
LCGEMRESVQRHVPVYRPAFKHHMTAPSATGVAHDAKPCNPQPVGGP